MKPETKAEKQYQKVINNHLEREKEKIDEVEREVQRVRKQLQNKGKWWEWKPAEL